MGSYWVYEVINMLGFSEGLFAAFTHSADEARDKIMKHLEYPAKSIKYIGVAGEYSELPAGCTIV